MLAALVVVGWSLGFPFAYPRKDRPGGRVFKSISSDSQRVHVKAYETLGIKPGSSQLEVKAAYRRLAKTYHPDVSSAAGAQEAMVELPDGKWVTRTTLERRFRDITDAFKELSRSKRPHQAAPAGWTSADKVKVPTDTSPGTEWQPVDEKDHAHAKKHGRRTEQQQQQTHHSQEPQAERKHEDDAPASSQRPNGAVKVGTTAETGAADETLPTPHPEGEGPKSSRLDADASAELMAHAATFRARVASAVEERFRTLIEPSMDAYLKDEIDEAELRRFKATARNEAEGENPSLSKLDVALAVHSRASCARVEAQDYLEATLDAYIRAKSILEAAEATEAQAECALEATLQKIHKMEGGATDGMVDD